MKKKTISMNCYCPPCLEFAVVTTPVVMVLLAPAPRAMAAATAAVVISLIGIPVMNDNRHGNPRALSQVYLRPVSEIRRNKNVIG